MWANTIERLKAELQNEKKIICFGCGEYFERFIYEYPELVLNIGLVLDNKVCIGKQKIVIRQNKEINIVNPEECKKLNLDKYVVLFCSALHENMKKQLDRLLGEENYTSFRYPLSEDFNIYSNKYKIRTLVDSTILMLEKYNNLHRVLDDMNIWDKESLKQKILKEEIAVIPRFTVILTTKCSLRCKECENIMWALRDARKLDKEKIKHSIEIICNVLDVIPVIDLIGGEPFVADCFDEILEFCICKKKIKKIEVVTNGTIVPDKRRIELLKNEKVSLMISRYENVVDWTPLLNCLDREKINYVKLNSEWYQTGKVDKRGRCKEDIRRQYYNCFSSLFCRAILEDKMYVCPRAAGMGLLGMIRQQDILDIKDSDDMKEKIMEFQILPKYEVCDFCDGGMENKIIVPAGEQE
ncbi:hypothetical protein IMSAGC011_01416 [Lachnospiraceae bacterium]|nr:hypothetical protein IMSAGC011_01416 [Lachnospiraceae bacterium]